MLPADLQQRLADAPEAPLYVHLPADDVPVWDLTFRPRQILVAFGGEVWDLSPFAAPHLANLWSQRLVHGFGTMPLQYFDRHAAVLPRQYVDMAALSEMDACLRRADMPPCNPQTAVALQAAVAACKAVRDRFAQGKWRPYRLYTADWLAARMLLAIMQGRGYLYPADAEGGAPTWVHPWWRVPAPAARITTARPPLHAPPRALLARYAARTGSRWVVLTWPDVATVLATRVVHKTPVVPISGSDAVLGRHDVPPPDPPLADAAVAEVSQLAAAWHATQQSYPIPVPSDAAQKSLGKMALEAVSAFTVAQLAILFRAWQSGVPALLGLSDVCPGLGSLAFQIDDRVPLPLVQRYAHDWHAFHVVPTVQVGQSRGVLYPVADPLTPVALDLDKPTQWPVECPVCGGRADCERDLQQHYLEDHGEAAQHV